MNASVGNVGANVTRSGVNTNNPALVQFFRLTSISMPARIFVFLDEPSRQHFRRLLCQS